MNNREVKFTEAIREAYFEEMTSNSDIVLFGEDSIGANRESPLGGFAELFPGRVFNNLPLIEDMICGIGLGTSLGGLKPVIELNYSTFVTMAMNDLYNIGVWRFRMAETSGPSIVFRIVHEGYLGKGTEFSFSTLPFFLHLPNTNVITPSSPYYAKGLLKSALRADNPTVFWEHKALHHKMGVVPKKEYLLPFGISEALRTGKDITIITWLYTAYLSLQAAERLSVRGIECDVISLQTLQPFDTGTILASLQKTKKVLIVEEGMKRGGYGAEIASWIVERLPFCRIERIGSPSVAIPPRTKNQERVLPTIETIYAAGLRLHRC